MKSDKYYIFCINIITSSKNLFYQVIITIGESLLVITTESKTFHFDVPKDAGINFKHNTYSLIKHNELLAQHKIKKRD